MKHEVLKRIIFDQHEVIRNSEIMKRDYTFEKQANYVLVGLRRAGKSTLLYSIVRDLIDSGVSWERIIYVNFEDERLSEFKIEDFNDILTVQAELSDEKGFFFFDEIQNVPGWEKFARRIADAKERVYITGSNAKMLSREIGTTLGGRFLTKYISPYSFTEYLCAKQVGTSTVSTRDEGRVRGEFSAYFRNGGLPETLLFQNKRDYLSSVCQKILLGDIVARNGLRNDTGIKILIKKIAESVRSEISYSKLHNALKAIGVSLSKDAVIDYISFIKDSYLVFDIQNYYLKFSERESTPKYYFSDNGILNLFLLDKDTALLENLVAVTLKERYEEVFYLKSPKTGVDVDFYIPQEKTAVQVAYSVSGEAREREISSLVRLSEASDSPEKYIIITYEEEETVSVGSISIRIIPIYKFLLNQ